MVQKKRARRVSRNNGTGPVIKTPGGKLLHLIAVDAERVYYLQSGAGSPEPPVIEHRGVGGAVFEIPDENDEAYLEELRAWQVKRRMRLMNFSCVMGVIENPPAEFSASVVDEIEYYEGRTPHKYDIKWEWLKSLYKSHPDGMWAGILELSAAVMELSMPTEEGIELAEESFPSGVQEKQFAMDTTEELEAESAEED